MPGRNPAARPHDHRDAATAYFAENNSYTGMTTANLESDFGYNPSGNNTVTMVSADDDNFEVTVESAAGTTYN